MNKQIKNEIKEAESHSSSRGGQGRPFKAAMTSEQKTWHGRVRDDSFRLVLFTELKEGVCLTRLWRNLMTLTATLAMFIMALGRLSHSTTRVPCFKGIVFCA